MTERPAIVTDRLTKVYRLYERPQQRILDVIGLARRGKYTEHHALDNVSISIGRGERLGIIGRNGAGKSTLLKVVSGVIPPTSGSVQVDGQARALLEIGTGFHPEFTGRENSKAYFAQLGISGREAAHLVDEVIEFSELEEYIDQPLKTYSTGMRLRLMFSTATVVAPDILVLDEVLGVGDAYFTRKSFDRINEMANRDGATLLLVSHDIYTSARICGRMIWLEKGKVVFDGDPKDAVKAYEDSIRLQEEARLRNKSLLALRRDQHLPDQNDVFRFEAASPDGRPVGSPVWFSSVRLLSGGKEVANLPLLDGQPTEGALDHEGTCWGDISSWRGRTARAMRDFGSPFHRVAGSFAASHMSNADLADLELAIDWGAEVDVELLVTCRWGDELSARRSFVVHGGGWDQIRLRVSDPTQEPTLLDEPPHRGATFGTGRIRITGARLRNCKGAETFTFIHGELMALSFDYEIRDPDLDEPCDIAVSILRGGVDTACRAFTRSLHLSYRSTPRGTITVTIDHLMLGRGQYIVNLQVAKNGYYARSGADQGALFFSINPEVHVAIRELIDFSVHAEGAVAEATAWVVDAGWSLGTVDLPTSPPI